MKKTITLCQKLFKFADKLMVSVVLFWFIETVIFLIAEGWHWKATSEAEKLCDIIVNIGFTAYFVIIGFVVVALLREFMQAKWIFNFEEKEQ